LKCENAATIVVSTATSMTTNSTLVSLPIWPILRNSATMISSVMPTPIALPRAVFPESDVTPGIRYPRYWTSPMMPVDMISGMDKEEGQQPSCSVLKRRAEVDVCAAGPWHGGPEFGPDQTVGQREDGADDPAEHGFGTADGGDHRRDGDERADAAHLRHVDGC